MGILKRIRLMVGNVGWSYTLIREDTDASGDMLVSAATDTRRKIGGRLQIPMRTPYIGNQDFSYTLNRIP